MTEPELSKHVAEITTKVAFHQCDPLNVVWHGRYFEWMEMARTELFGGVGLEVDQLQNLGHRMYVVESHCRYMEPLHYGDPVRIVAWFREVLPLLRIAYNIYNAATTRRAARAYTVLAVTDAQGQLLPRTPDAFVDRIALR